ncbi:mitochondrial ribonuclease P protein 1 homolog [Atheta coriaria]|uniref:mitochondrial ribonuclease P protein 1 homolog n=1 Tax=Dalotia coriaria TaxID=877792 RepID=UPI0031F3A958
MFNLSRNCNKLVTICKLSSCNYTIFTKLPKKLVETQNVTKNLPLLQFPPKIRFYCSSESDIHTLTDEEITEITGGDEDQIHKLKVLLLETEVLRQEGKPVPSPAKMKVEHWKELLSKETRTGRRKYLDFLFKIEKIKENRIIKKQQKQLERKERPPIEQEQEGAIRYDLGHNHMFLRFYDSTMNNMYNAKLIRAMQFSQKIVIDCGYHEHMTKRENINCAKQLMLLFAENRAHDDPFDIHYCNLKKDAELEDYMHRFIPTMYDPEFPLNAHESSYLDLFPKENLVYLTPHCRQELTEFDHDATYIIGGIVDKINNEPVSMAKAKREGLKMAKLPLDQYLHWGSGSGKSLTLNQVLSIMLDIRMTGDWNHALRHVPKRKIMQDDEFAMINQRKNPWQSSRERNYTQQSVSNNYNRKTPPGDQIAP